MSVRYTAQPVRSLCQCAHFYSMSLTFVYLLAGAEGLSCGGAAGWLGEVAGRS